MFDILNTYCLTHIDQPASRITVLRVGTKLEIIIILSFDIAPFPYTNAQRRITFHCQSIDADILIVN